VFPLTRRRETPGFQSEGPNQPEMEDADRGLERSNE
jgi:hypothetical protein